MEQLNMPGDIQKQLDDLDVILNQYRSLMSDTEPASASDDTHHAYTAVAAPPSEEPAPAQNPAVDMIDTLSDEIITLLKGDTDFSDMFDQKPASASSPEYKTFSIDELTQAFIETSQQTPRETDHYEQFSAPDIGSHTPPDTYEADSHEPPLPAQEIEISAWKRPEPVITDQQLKALTRKHLFIMIRDLQRELRKEKEEKEKLILAYKAGLARNSETHQAVSEYAR